MGHRGELKEKKRVDTTVEGTTFNGREWRIDEISRHIWATRNREQVRK